MYFLSGEESKWLSRYLIPKIRETGVADELRGWNWHQPPLEPPYACKLAVYEVAGKYCTSGRDIYLRRVCGKEAVMGKAATAGVVYHSAITQIINEAKRVVYQYGPGQISKIKSTLKSYKPNTNGENPVDKALAESAKRLVEFEVERIIARIDDVLSRQPYVGADSLVTSALPVTCEYKLDGSFLGLSNLISCDAATLGGTVVFDLKFGKKQDFHKLSATGYALVMESLWEFPVDIGCTVYVDLRGQVPGIKRELYAIDDELRQWFIDERDDKMRIVSQQCDPGLADDCYVYCGYMKECKGNVG